MKEFKTEVIPIRVTPSFKEWLKTKTSNVSKFLIKDLKKEYEKEMRGEK